MQDEILVLRCDEHMNLQALYPTVVGALIAGVQAEQLGMPGFLSHPKHLKAPGRSHAVGGTLLAGVPQNTLIAEELPTAHRPDSALAPWLYLLSGAECPQEGRSEEHTSELQSRQY